MPTKRIEYIDAMRGFTMILVVYSHIWTFCYHAYDTHSFANILSNFFLVLFFFISGFVAYKKDTSLSAVSTARILKNKFVQLIIPSVVFYVILCAQFYDLSFVRLVARGEYWFTVQLFLFYLFYVLSSKLIRIGEHSISWDFVLLGVALLLYCISYSHVLIERTQIGANLFLYLGMKYWRYYVFFCLGILVRKHFSRFVKLTDNGCIMAAFIILFFALIFLADCINFPMWKPIRMLVYGGVSVVVIFTFFRRYEGSFTSTNKFGYCIQYIGRRTLDVYMIHYFFLPRNLDSLGSLFNEYTNPSVEFFITTLLSLLVILVSIIVGNIIRLSPVLSHYLLGDK